MYESEIYVRVNYKQIGLTIYIHYGESKGISAIAIRF